MKGFRTLILNGFVVVGTAGLTWMVGIDWTEWVSPTAAMVIIGAANIGLRLITTTPVGQKDG